MLLQILPDFFLKSEEESISFLTAELNKEGVTGLSISPLLSGLTQNEQKKKLTLILNVVKEVKHLVTLDVSYNQLGEEMLAWLIHALKETTIQKIIVSSNYIKNIERINAALKESPLIEIEGLERPHNETIATIINRWLATLTGKTIDLEDPLFSSIAEQWLKETLSLPTTSSESDPPINISQITIALLETFSTLTETEVKEDIWQWH